MKEKSQAALEYLITYGWAILGILVVGLVLWQFGAFNPPAPQPGCSGFSEIKPIDWKASIDGNFVTTLTNEAGLKLNLTRVDVEIANANCGEDTTIKEIYPGEGYQVTISCSDLSNEYASGEYYKAHIVIEYDNPQSGISHKSAGECWGSVE